MGVCYSISNLDQPYPGKLSSDSCDEDSFDPCEDALAPCNLLSYSMQDVLESDGLPMLHRSKWRCLAASYSKEIEGLILTMRLFFMKLEPWEKKSILRKLAGPLLALEKAVQEGEACMQDYMIPKRNHRSWLAEKAVKLALSTDVVDVHLHQFLWVSSTLRHHLLTAVRHQLSPMIDDSHIAFMVKYMTTQTSELCKIWKKVDAKNDLHIAEDLLMQLKAQIEKDTESCKLVDFILCKLSHLEALHNHVTHLSSPPNYMCIDADQCLWTNTEHLFKNHSTEIRKVAWFGGHFALKIFQHLDCSNPTEMQKFNREAAIQASVCHSHVVPLVCCTSKPPGLLMELMQEDLHSFITNRKNLGKDPPFSLLMAVDLMLQIAKGMECLHGDTLRIIHRDLKSLNILVSFPKNSRISEANYDSDANPQVHLKIADFGVSKAKHDCSIYTTLDQGTTSWMAPEVYGGEVESNKPSRYSHKADVYSFGMVCFEILTGNLPFEGGDIRSRVLNGERPKLLPHCPTALSSLIQMCWDKEPSMRPNFTQICRILRYFKACIFLKHPHVHEAHHDDWLSSPLTSLDFSIKDILNGLGHKIEPSPLRIPLEMCFFGIEVLAPGFVHNCFNFNELV